MPAMESDTWRERGEGQGEGGEGEGEGREIERARKLESD